MFLGYHHVGKVEPFAYAAGLKWPMLVSKSWLQNPKG